jgi:TonB family protein
MLRDRRARPRLNSCPFVYLSVTPDNGGILLNLSTTGLALQAISPLRAGQQVQFEMDLPGVVARISTKAEIAWTDASGELAGARFLNVPAVDQEQIRTWMALQKDLQTTRESAPVPPITEDRELYPQSAVQAEGEENTLKSSSEVAVEDELGELRSAVLQSKTLETKTPPPASRVVAFARNFSAKHKLIASVTLAVLAFAVLAGELIYYARRGAFAEVEGSVIAFKKTVLQSQDVPRWIAGALSEEPKSDAPIQVARTLSRKVSKRHHSKLTKSGSKSSTPPRMGNATLPLEMSLPVGRTQSFLIRGNRQVLTIPAEGTGWDPLGAQPRMSPEGPSVRVYSESSGAPPQKYEPPSYPEAALQTNTQGSVVVQATINKDGIVKEVNVLSGDPLLAAAVTDALRGWKFRPYIHNGTPVEGDVRIRVIFAISKN